MESHCRSVWNCRLFVWNSCSVGSRLLRRCWLSFLKIHLSRPRLINLRSHPENPHGRYQKDVSPTAYVWEFLSNCAGERGSLGYLPRVCEVVDGLGLFKQLFLEQNKRDTICKCRKVPQKTGGPKRFFPTYEVYAETYTVTYITYITYMTHTSPPSVWSEIPTLFLSRNFHGKSPTGKTGWETCIFCPQDGLREQFEARKSRKNKHS